MNLQVICGNIYRNWEVAWTTTGTLTQILADGAITIPELLDDEDFIAELQIQNEKVLDILTDEALLQMVDYIIIEPEITDDQKRTYKYPFVTCAAFCTDCTFIHDKLLDKPNNYPILNKILNLFEVNTSYCLNSTLVGYVNKIISFQMKQKPNKFAEFIVGESQKRHLNNFLKHCSLLTCTDLIVRFFTMQLEDPGETLKIDYLKARQEFLGIILSKIGSPEEVMSTLEKGEIYSSILSELCMRMYSMLDGDQIMKLLIESSHIAQILQAATTSTENKLQVAVFKYISTLFSCCFIKEPKDISSDDIEANFGFQFESPEDAGREEEKEGKAGKPKEEKKGGEINLLKAVEKYKIIAGGGEKYFNYLNYKDKLNIIICEYLDKVYLILEIKECDMKYEKKEIRIGRVRIYILNFLINIIKLDQICISRAIQINKLAFSVIDLFLISGGNSFWHNGVLEFLEAILAQTNPTLIHHILFECKILPNFIDHATNHKILFKGGEKLRTEKFGQILRFIREIISRSKGSGEINNLLNRSIEECKTMPRFVADYMREEREKEEAKLGESDFFYEDPPIEREEEEKKNEVLGDIIVDHSTGKKLTPNEVDLKIETTITKKIVQKSLNVNKKLTDLAKLI